MQFHFHLVRSGFLDGFFKHHRVFGKFDILELGEQFVGDVLRSHRTEGFAALAGLEFESQFDFADFAGKFLGEGDFAGLAFRAFGFEVIDLADRRARGFDGFAPGQESSAGVTATHADEVCFRSKGGNVFGENNFSVSHDEIEK